MTFLYTDVLLWTLALTVVAFALYASRVPHLRAPWHSVMQNRLALVSLVILMGFIGIALLDSIHFTTAPSDQIASADVRSLLDTLLGNLDLRLEKSYSKPFATHLYMKETMSQAAGTVTRDYPPLQFVSVDSKPLVLDLIQALTIGVISCLIIGAVIVKSVGRRYQLSLSSAIDHIRQHKTTLPWTSLFYTLSILILFTSIALALTGHYHILGTDKVGNDVFYISIKSIRTGLIIGTLTTLVILPFAMLFGTIAGYFGGLIDDIIQYIYTTLSSIPGVLLIAAAVLSLQIYISNHSEAFPTLLERADARLLALCVILGITSWTTLCRVLRAETLKLRELDYVQAARTLGVGHLRIITRHILPNVMHIVIITLILDFSALVLAEAVLSYVGVGVDPTTHSWGNMINSARLEMAREPIVWWPLLSAFVFMFTLVLCANLFSDAVRDAFDPRHQSKLD